MPENEKKTQYQKLEEKLHYSSKNIWSEVDDKAVKGIFDCGEKYKDFLTRAKSERLTVKWILENAKKKGYKDLYAAKEIKPGNTFFAVNRNKNIALIKIGKKDIKDGINFIVAHADAPRLDLKQIPLVEDTEIALLKTQYYGGIKKYQWLNIPLALVGVVVTKDNKTVEIEIGLNDGDPVFIIPDLLPHLSKKVQDQKKAAEFIEGETLNLVCGNIPVKDEKIKEKVKLAVLERLNKDYGIVEEDFISAELEAVPVMQPRDVGIDRSLIGGYAHDDRVSTFSAVMSIFDSKVGDKTQVTLIVDKEETGSDGPTGAKSLFIFNVVGTVIDKLSKNSTDSILRGTMQKSLCISADVNGAIHPMYKSVHDEINDAKLSHGIVLTKYTGHRGKYEANDADAEFVGKVRWLFNKNGIFWQYGSLGKVDEGGGGTIAKYFASYNASVIDCGVPVIGMHSPYELISKADLYFAYKGYKVFFEQA
ncbi:MAG: aminopeptidase [Spirochaetota bacterium]|nr:MAG: aminopeptidase [Spirochaetota bacterium]